MGYYAISLKLFIESSHPLQLPGWNINGCEVTIKRQSPVDHWSVTWPGQWLVAAPDSNLSTRYAFQR